MSTGSYNESLFNPDTEHRQLNKYAYSILSRGIHTNQERFSLYSEQLILAHFVMRNLSIFKNT